nr:glycosyltransferase [Acholeplasma laidlawii]
MREKRIISAGRLVDQKNYSLLIKSFSRINQIHPGYKLVIYGDGPLLGQLIDEAKILLPEDSFSFPGKISNILDEINKSTCFVLTSDYEGLPNVIIESLSMGVPVISTDTSSGGPQSIVKNGINGYLVPVGDVNTLTDKISKLLGDLQIGKQLEMDIDEIKKKYDSVSVAKKWLNFISY